MIRAVGTCSALLAFSLAVFRGLAVRNPPIVVLERAIWAMVLFFMLGTALGWVARRIVIEHVLQKESETLVPYQIEQQNVDENESETSEPSTEGNSTSPDSEPIAT